MSRQLLVATSIALTAVFACGDNKTIIEQSPVITLGEDTTWDSSRELDRLYRVPTGVTLTIRQGVEVTLITTAGLLVEGTLTLEGDADQGVTFKAAGSENGGFGVTVTGANDSSTLDFATFQGVDLTLNGNATAAVDGATFENSTLFVSNRGAFTLSNATISDNLRFALSGVIARSVTPMTVSDSTFAEFTTGLSFRGVQADASLTVTNTTFDNGTTAIAINDVGNFPASATLDNVTVTNILSTGIVSYLTTMSVANSTITDVNGNGIFADLGSTVTVTDTDIRRARNLCGWFDGPGATLTRVVAEDCGNRGILVGANATIDTLTVTNADGVGLDASGDGLDASNVTITNVTNDGIEAEGNVILTDITVTDALVACIDIRGNTSSVSTANLTNCGADGISALASATLVGVTVLSANDDCIDANDAGLSVNNSNLQDCGDKGVEGNGLASVTNTMIDDCVNYGIRLDGGALTVSGTDVAGVGVDGIIVTDADLDVSDTTVDGADGNAIFVVDGDVVADSVTLTNSGNRGMNIIGTATVSNAVIDTAGSTGILMDSGSVTTSDISNVGQDGIWVTGTAASTISLCDISGNSRYGIRGNSLAGVTNVAITNNNLTENANFAVRDGGLLDGNYIADNRGLVATVDTTAGGTLDGAKDVNSAQVSLVDQIINAQSSPRTDTGPPSP